MLLHFQLQHHKLPLSSGLLEHFLFLWALSNSLLGAVIKVLPSHSKAFGAPTKLSVLKTSIFLGFSWGSIPHPGIQILGHGDLSSIQSLSCVRVFVTPWTAAHSLWPHGLPPCPSPTSRVCSNWCLLSQWCYPTISSSVIPFSSRLQSFPASEPFPMSQFFPSGGQSNGGSASASVLPVNGEKTKIHSQPLNFQNRW